MKTYWRCVNDLWKYCDSSPSNPLPIEATCDRSQFICGSCLTLEEINKKDGTLEWCASRKSAEKPVKKGK